MSALRLIREVRAGDKKEGRATSVSLSKRNDGRRGEQMSSARHMAIPPILAGGIASARASDICSPLLHKLDGGLSLLMR